MFFKESRIRIVRVLYYHYPIHILSRVGDFTEIYYWDSYFTMEGLAASGRIDLVEAMLENFACLIQQFGYIPNGNRTYYLGRSQPPFFAEMIKLYMKETSDSNGIKFIQVLEQEYKFWTNSSHIRKIGSETGYLNHYTMTIIHPDLKLIKRIII